MDRPASAPRSASTLALAAGHRVTERPSRRESACSRAPSTDSSRCDSARSSGRSTTWPSTVEGLVVDLAHHAELAHAA